MLYHANSAEARIYWNGLENGDKEDLLFYELYIIKADGSKEFMETIPN